MNNQISLHNGMLAIAGTIAILAGLTFNAYLMTTYAEGLGIWMQAGMALLGVVLDTIKIAFIVLAGSTVKRFLWRCLRCYW